MVKKIIPELSIAGIAALLFVPFLGQVHLFDWDEINFAECAREMLVTGEYGRVYLNFIPFWEKPPFFFWLQALAMQVFGVGEFAARLPNALCGMVTLVCLYRIGKSLYNQQFGLLWALVYAGSVLPHFYFHSGLIDPWFNLFIFLSLTQFFLAMHPQKDGQNRSNALKNHLFAGLLLGLALITKGPVSILVFGLVFLGRWGLARSRFPVSIPKLSLMALGVLLVSSLWVGVEVLKNGTWFFEEFIRYSYRLFSTPDAGHGGFPGYHVVVLLFGCFPASFFFIHGHFLKPESNAGQKEFRIYMLLLFWVVLILFSLVKSKIVHYSSLCYFPLSFVAAQSISHFISSRQKLPAWIWISLLFVGVLLALVCSAFPYLTSHTDLIRPLFEKDPFAMANLDAQVRWDGWEWLVGLFILTYILATIFHFQKRENQKGVVWLFGGSGMMVVLILWAFIGRIESFSQGAMIDFYESLAGKDCYVLPFNHKSYAPYFYTRLVPENAPVIKNLNELTEEMNHWRDSLLTSPLISKPVFVVTKINRKEGLENYPELRLLYEKNGWSFYERKPTGEGNP